MIGLKQSIKKVNKLQIDLSLVLFINYDKNINLLITASAMYVLLFSCSCILLREKQPMDFGLYGILLLFETLKWQIAKVIAQFICNLTSSY